MTSTHRSYQSLSTKMPWSQIPKFIFGTKPILHVILRLYTTLLVTFLHRNDSVTFWWLIHEWRHELCCVNILPRDKCWGIDVEIWEGFGQVVPSRGPILRVYILVPRIRGSIITVLGGHVGLYLILIKCFENCLPYCNTSTAWRPYVTSLLSNHAQIKPETVFSSRYFFNFYWYCLNSYFGFITFHKIWQKKNIFIKYYTM